MAEKAASKASAAEKADKAAAEAVEKDLDKNSDENTQVVANDGQVIVGTHANEVAAKHDALAEDKPRSSGGLDSGGVSPEAGASSEDTTPSVVLAAEEQPYKESDDHVPNPVDVFGYLDTTGYGSHPDPASQVSPVFKNDTNEV